MYYLDIIKRKKVKPYFIALNLLSENVFEVPILFLNVIGISTIFKLFSIQSIVIKIATRPLPGVIIGSSVPGLTN